MVEAPYTHEEELLVLTDQELVGRIASFVREHVIDDATSSELNWLLGEAFERWAPEGAWVECRRVAGAFSPDDPEQRERELDAMRRALIERVGMRATRTFYSSGRR